MVESRPGTLNADTCAATPKGAAPERRFLPKGWGGLNDYLAPPLPLVAGETYQAWHPFTKGEYDDLLDLEDPASGAVCQAPKPVATWIPGFRFEPCGQYGEDTEEVWDGEGVQLRTIVSLHKPGPTYPERVFFVRQWKAPSGKVFGKTGLRIAVAGEFRRWLRGERWPSFSEAREAHVAWALPVLVVAPEEASPRQVAPPIRDDLESVNGRLA